MPNESIVFTLQASCLVHRPVGRGLGERRRTRLVKVLLLGLLMGLPCLAKPNPPGIALTPEEQRWLQAHPVITLAPDPDFKPIESFNKDGDYEGAAADIVHILEKKLGIKITIARLANWDEAMAKFRNHEVDLLGAMVRTPEREKFALFTETLVAVPGGIFARTGSPTNLAIKDLKGKRVAVVSNYAAHDLLRNQCPDLNLVVVPDVSTGLAKASLGMVDVYVENLANATFYAQEAGITNLELVGRTDFDYRWGIGIRKDWPELQSILNKGLAAIGKEEREQALQRWIFIEGQHWRPSKLMVIGAVAVSLGAVLLLVVYWNRQLSHRVRSRTASLQTELVERRRVEAELNALTIQLDERVQERTQELEREILVRRKSEQAALLSEQRFRELFQNVADPIYISDLTGQLLAANDQACRELGYSQEELCAMHIQDLDVVFDAVPKITNHVQGYSDDAPTTFESEHRRKDGSTFPVEIRVQIIDFGGQPAAMGVARNISERKQAEAERLRLDQQLLHAQKLESLGVLAGGIAHDFNNILTAIIGNADLALMGIEPGSPAVRNLHNIEQAAARASDLARQMLAYSGKGRFTLAYLDLNRLVEEMLPMLEFSISKKVRLRLDLGQALPSVEGDATQLRQVIMNLVINASEAIGDRDGVIAIKSGCLDFPFVRHRETWLQENLREGTYDYLEIADNGCGMDPAILAKIFDPFFTTKFTGRGLGMAAILGILRSHKGAITIDSQPGQGSVFQVLLPASIHPAEPPNPERREEAWTGTGTILLVDDEEPVRATGSDMLGMLGFTTLTAADGQAALEAFQRNPDISVVILDLTMPIMDGEEAFHALRRLDPGVKVILSSGYSEQDVTLKFANMGLAGFIQKPYTYRELRDKIRQALDDAQ